MDFYAQFDPTGAYRYLLGRRWAAARSTVTFVMLNPSTADERRDDPTIRRCLAFARRWGHGNLNVVNLFAWRATTPGALARVCDPIGPDNDRFVLAACQDAQQIVLAWGNHGRLYGRAAEVLMLLAGLELEERLCCLGVTRSGEPRHPLYLPGSLEPQPFSRFVYTCGG